MFHAIVLNLASAAVVVGGWSLAVRALHKGLGGQPAPAVRLYARHHLETDCLCEPVLSGQRAA